MKILFYPFILMMALVWISSTSQEQQKSKILDSEIIKGKLRLKPWTKSGQSYCAQGSAYYVLETQIETFILDFDKDKFSQKFVQLQDQNIQVRGRKRTKRIPHPKNPMAQHPVTTDINGNTLDYFECEIFEVLEIV